MCICTLYQPSQARTSVSCVTLYATSSPARKPNRAAGTTRVAGKGSLYSIRIRHGVILSRDDAHDGDTCAQDLGEGLPSSPEKSETAAAVGSGGGLKGGRINFSTPRDTSRQSRFVTIVIKALPLGGARNEAGQASSLCENRAKAPRTSPRTPVESGLLLARAHVEMRPRNYAVYVRAWFAQALIPWRRLYGPPCGSGSFPSTPPPFPPVHVLLIIRFIPRLVYK